MPDLSLLDLILSLYAEPGDLILQELVDALPDGLHGLAGAGDTEVSLGAQKIRSADKKRAGLDQRSEAG